MGWGSLLRKHVLDFGESGQRAWGILLKFSIILSEEGVSNVTAMALETDNSYTPMPSPLQSCILPVARYLKVTKSF